MPKTNLTSCLKDSFNRHQYQNAFCIKDTYYTYLDLTNTINKLRQVIQDQIKEQDKIIGLIVNDDLETYATIFALWFEGKAYIPLNPAGPKERNIDILNTVGTKIIFDSSYKPTINSGFTILSQNNASSSPLYLKNKTFSNKEIAYILFTSGSTGQPKGVEISFKNLNTLIQSIDDSSMFNLTPNDRCLQMYNLTFDASLTAILPALLSGACLYTVPDTSIKYLHIFKLLDTYKLTVLKMVPSIVYYLQPYFSEIKAPQVKYCTFGGEKLFEDIIKAWSSCIPNSKIYNHYGPTECTVCSTYYQYDSTNNKSHNGVISIGKVLSSFNYIIVNEDLNEVEKGKKGELCLAGNQLTTGYWKNENLNKQSFFAKNSQRYYKTGDICFEDKNGDLMYVDRKDYQVKIGGYRIELGEIEFHAKQYFNKTNLIALSLISKPHNTNYIALIIEGNKQNTEDLIKHLEIKLPNYMVPTKIYFLQNFPMNANGKLDKNKIKDLIL